MDLRNLLLISLLLSVGTSFALPIKPLNERSTDLAWQAWLLVDQSRQSVEAATLRRRITPKSVFIAPTFSPDTLPSCADGYKSDAMGRCVKIIRINESVHFDFLLQQLNDKFSDYDDEDADQSEPFQLSIPLDGGVVGGEAPGESDSDFAIVVTPVGEERTYDTTYARNDGGAFSVESVAAILGVRADEVEVTTIAQLTTTNNNNDSLPSTTTETSSESTTSVVMDDGTSLSTVTEPSVTADEGTSTTVNTTTEQESLTVTETSTMEV